jgi:hypothetical protein
MRLIQILLSLSLLYSCQAQELGRSSSQASAVQTEAKQVLMSTTWRDPDSENTLCLEGPCDQYYLVMNFSSSTFTRSLYDKVTKKKVAGQEKVYGLSNLDNDSFIRTSDGELATYVITGKNLEVCFQGEGCYSFYQE